MTSNTTFDPTGPAFTADWFAVYRALREENSGRKLSSGDAVSVLFGASRARGSRNGTNAARRRPRREWTLEAFHHSQHANSFYIRRPDRIVMGIARDQP